MGEPYTIHIFVTTGDPRGVKLVTLMNWTGVGIAFPRTEWPQLKSRSEFNRAGVYILSGTEEGRDDELPTIYVGQGDGIGNRIDAHYGNRDFWEWGYAFVSNANALNRAHITWLEHALIHRAVNAERCNLDNANQPKEPGLSESERADTDGFLREMLRILPLLGVHVFEKPIPVATPGSEFCNISTTVSTDDRDTVIVPALEKGFNEVFLGQDCWHAIRIGGGMLPKLKYIAAYQSAPVSAITHYAPVERIEPYGEEGKYRLVFSEPAKALPQPVPFANAPPGTMQGSRYTTLKKLLSAKCVSDLIY